MGQERPEDTTAVVEDPDAAVRRPSVGSPPAPLLPSGTASRAAARSPRRAAPDGGDDRGHATDGPIAVESFTILPIKELTMSVVSYSADDGTGAYRTESRRTATFGRMAATMRDCVAVDGFDVRPME
jgi:hypothetical protein